MVHLKPVLLVVIPQQGVHHNLSQMYVYSALTVKSVAPETSKAWHFTFLVCCTPGYCRPGSGRLKVRGRRAAAAAGGARPSRRWRRRRAATPSRPSSRCTARHCDYSRAQLLPAGAPSLHSCVNRNNSNTARTAATARNTLRIAHSRTANAYNRFILIV